MFSYVSMINIDPLIFNQGCHREEKINFIVFLSDLVFTKLNIVGHKTSDMEHSVRNELIILVYGINLVIITPRWSTLHC